MSTPCEAGESRRDTRDPSTAAALRFREVQPPLRMTDRDSGSPLTAQIACLLTFVPRDLYRGRSGDVEHGDDNRVIVGQGSLLWWRRLIVQKGLFHGKLAACGANHFLRSS